MHRGNAIVDFLAPATGYHDPSTMPVDPGPTRFSLVALCMDDPGWPVTGARVGHFLQFKHARASDERKLADWRARRQSRRGRGEAGAVPSAAHARDPRG